MSIADTATTLLTKFGEAVTLTYETNEVRNPATGEITTPATENEASGFGYPSRYQNAEVDGTVVQRSDTRLILNKVTQKPEQGWRAQVQGKTFRVMDVQPITKSGADVIYICQLRV
jgi:hypothetical protein